MSQSMSHLAHLSPAKKSPTGNGNHRSGGQNKGKCFKKNRYQFFVKLVVSDDVSVVMVPYTPIHMYVHV